ILPKEIDEYALEIINLAAGVGGQEWGKVTDLICAGARSFINDDFLASSREKADVWYRSSAPQPRLVKLTDILVHQPPGAKHLVFTGAQGAVPSIANHLRTTLGEHTVTEFRFELSDDEKEESVRRFRSDKTVRVLISDESGGEGRNFQFADEIIHL